MKYIYHNYKNTERNIIIQIMKPVILISYIKITNNYIQHDVNMHILPVFSADSKSSVHKPYIIHSDKNCNSSQVFIKHTLHIVIKIVILYVYYLNIVS